MQHFFRFLTKCVISRIKAGTGMPECPVITNEILFMCNVKQLYLDICLIKL